MERSFECPVCFEQFSSKIKPLLIPCGHTVCIQCLEGLKRDRVLDCPVCRTPHHNLSISALSPNYALIQSETPTKTSTSLEEKIEELHKQISLLQSLQSKVHDSSCKSKLSIDKIKSELNNKLDLLNGIISGIHKSINSELEGIERQATAKGDKIEAQLNALIEERVELMQSLQQNYAEKSEIPSSVKMRLASISLPEIQVELCSYQLQSEGLEFADRLKKFFGTIQEEKLEKLGVESSRAKADEAKSPEKIQEKEGSARGSTGIRGIVDRGIRRVARAIGRGRGEVREEGKQPRQGRSEEPGWFVENRLGNLERLPPWFELQIKAGQEKGENTVNILDKGRPVYMVNFQEQKSYVISRNGKLGSALKLIFNPE